MTRTYGTATLQHVRGRDTWVIDCEPHIRLRMKRVFAKLDEQWIALDVEKIPAAQSGAAYVVVGAQDARYIRKDNRGKFGTLYRKHVCAQGKNARALAGRQRADAVESRQKARGKR